MAAKRNGKWDRANQALSHSVVGNKFLVSLAYALLLLIFNQIVRLA